MVLEATASKPKRTKIYRSWTMSEVNRTVTDPVAGTIPLPFWFLKIKDIPVVRRMLFIKQLGLKAYVDFPGAMHTRYSHALGVMHLAGKVAEILESKLRKQNDEAASVVSDNKDNLMAAGFLHDIGHGPFSHTVDFVLERIVGKTHEELTHSIIKTEIPETIDSGGSINKKSVLELLAKPNSSFKCHQYQFLHQIIDGPLDVDKLDYLLRDAYHVGFKYSFDLDHFLSTYSVLGILTGLSDCSLGLENSRQAIVTAEIFLVMWKSMYDLVYYKRDSRIAEKMLEKIILMNKEHPKIQEAFGSKFIELHDEELLRILKELNPKAEQFVSNIRNERLYRMLKCEFLIDVEAIPDMQLENIDRIQSKENIVADNLSKIICKEYQANEYSIICDIITSKKPGEISLERQTDQKEEDKLVTRSSVVKAIQKTSVVRAYADPEVIPKLKDSELQEKLKLLIKDSPGELFA
jgi:HD superfamily phosphohydrolase